MKFQLSINEDDRLQCLLYSASKNPSIKKRRLTSWLVLSLGSFVLGGLFYISHNNTLTHYFLILGCVYLIFYPFYQRYHYKEHYRKLARKKQESAEGSIADVSISDEYLEVSGNTSEAKMKLSEIGEIIEVKDQYYLKFKKSDSYFMIPKSCLQPPDKQSIFMHELADKLTIPFTSDINWKWR